MWQVATPNPLHCSRVNCISDFCRLSFGLGYPDWRSILLIFSKTQLWVLSFFSTVFLFSIWFISANYYYLFSSTCLKFFFFSSCRDESLDYWFYLSFLISPFNAINEPLSTAFAAFHFPLVQNILNFSWDLFWPMSYLEVCCLISKHFKIF